MFQLLNFLNTNISPFIDAKVGYSIADVKGLFLSLTVGCRFGFSNNTAFTVCVGYVFQRTDCFTAIKDMSGHVDIVQHKKNVGGLTVKIGVDF